MKKIYLTLSAIALTTCALVAQNNKMAASHTTANLTVANTTANKVIKNNSTQAAGDTVWIFDGGISYNWDGNLPGTYSVAIEDIDNKNIVSNYTASFGAKGSFKFFYYVDPAATNLHYGHADTVYFGAATSWFTPAGVANNWLEFGPIHVPTGGATLNWLHNYIDFGYRDAYEIKVNTVGLASTNFTGAALFTITDNDASTVGDTVNTPTKMWYPRSANMDAYAGQDVYIAVHHNGNDQNILEVTNFVMVENGLTGVKNNSTDFHVGVNVPNPANGSTTVNYSLNKNSNVLFTVTDLTGKVMFTENMNNVSAGAHNVTVNTASFSSGMYFYNFVVNGNKVTRKFVVAN